MEDRTDWQVDLYAMLRQRGYVQEARSRQNIVFRLA